jgi:hypothetical protein
MLSVFMKYNNLKLDLCSNFRLLLLIHYKNVKIGAEIDREDR